MHKISYNQYLDKVYGCWYGKCLGGGAGAPVEGIKRMIDIDDFTQIFDPNLPNDDLDLQLLWLDTLERKGTLIDSCDLADAWVKNCWYPFSEYGYFLKNYMRGVKPPYSGIINNSFFMEGMGCAIRSEIWGLINPGNPKLASEYAYMDAVLDHAGNAVYAEQFLAAVESMAFFETDIEKLVKAGMEYIPQESKLYRCFSRILCAYHKKQTWTAVRIIVLNEFSHPDFSNVVQNLGLILLSLLYGEGDMRKTINIALQCGYDTDCTCATAASVIGIIKGYSGIDRTMKALIQDYFVVGIDIKRPSQSIRRLAQDTAKIGLKAPNYAVEIYDAPYIQERPKDFKGFALEYANAQGMDRAVKQLTARRWEIYGPYFDQPDQPIDPRYPSPHGENSVLPDLVCMVNNEVLLNKKYITDFKNEKPVCIIDAYEDLIEIDRHLTLEGQICCYAKTAVFAKEDKKIWAVIGNNDGFKIWCNGEEILSKDELRYWTPYNNFTLLELKKGENEILLKLLRRTQTLKFAIGFREYDGCHWHRSKWCIDI